MIADLVKLEVSADPPAGVYPNGILNPNGALGGYFWGAPLAGATIGAALAVPGQLEYRAATGANVFQSELIPTNPGRFVNVGWISPYVRGFLRIVMDFFDANRVQIGSTTQSGYFGASPAWRYRTPAAAPAGATHVRVRFNHYRTNTGTNAPAGWTARVSKVTVVQAATAAEIAVPVYTEATYWRDVTSAVSKIDTLRGDLDAGELTAILRDKTGALDPAVSTALNSGRAVRLSAFDGADWGVVFLGTAQRPTVTYAGPRRTVAVITLTALDAHAAWAAYNRPIGTYDVERLPFLFEGAGVPWNVEGNTGQVGAVPASRRYNAPADTSVLAHLRRVRNSYYDSGSTSFYVAAWIDRFGVGQVWRSYEDQARRRALIRDYSFAVGIEEWEPAPALQSGWIAAGIAYNTAAPYGAALKITSAAAGYNLAATTPLPVRPRQRLTGQWAIRLGTAPAGRMVRAYVCFRDAAGGAIALLNLASTTQYSATGYGGYVRSVTVPEGAATAELHYIIDGAAGAGETIYVARSEFFISSDAVLGQNDLTDAPLSHGDGDNFNRVTIDTIYSGTDGTGSTQETHGPYSDAASVSQNGGLPATVETVGWAASNANLAAFTAYLLARNATPERHVEQLVIPVRNQAEVTRHAFRDVWDLLQITWPIADDVRVVSVAHSIEATTKGGRWISTVDVASPSRLIL